MRIPVQQISGQETIIEVEPDETIKSLKQQLAALQSSSLDELTGRMTKCRWTGGLRCVCSRSTRLGDDRAFLGTFDAVCRGDRGRPGPGLWQHQQCGGAPRIRGAGGAWSLPIFEPSDAKTEEPSEAGSDSTNVEVDTDKETFTLRVVPRTAAGSINKLGGYPTCYWRFLRSCNMDLKAAEQKLRATLRFRQRQGANDLLQSERACQVFERLKDAWPEAWIGTTSDGSPVSFFDVGKAVRFLQLGVAEDELRLFWMFWMERSNEQQRNGLARASGSIDPHDMPGTVVIYDLKELLLSSLTSLGWYIDASHRLRSCLSGLHTLVKVLGLAEKHYPSNLRKAIVLNAPTIFSRMVWPLVHKVLDSETRNNVSVCDSLEGLQLAGFSASELVQMMNEVSSHSYQYSAAFPTGAVLLVSVAGSFAPLRSLGGDVIQSCDREPNPCRAAVDTGSGDVLGPKDIVDSLLLRLQITEACNLTTLPKIEFRMKGVDDRSGEKTVFRPHLVVVTTLLLRGVCASDGPMDAAQIALSLVGLQSTRQPVQPVQPLCGLKNACIIACTNVLRRDKNSHTR
eukprot:g10780.t1